MKVVFVSNFMNHHQFYWCNALYEHSDVEFRFVATTPVPEDRLLLGYSDLNSVPFVIRAYESEVEMNRAVEACRECDAMIFGAAPEMFAQIRLKSNKLLLRYQERLFRKGWIYGLSPRARRNIKLIHKKNENKNVFLLCSGAFVSYDFSRVNVYRDKAYTWGYFTDVTREKSLEEILNEKKPNSILWCGRLIPLKHPEYAIEVAKRLKNDGIEFHMTFVGNGILYNEMTEKIKEYGLTEQIDLVGNVPSDETHKYMEESDIFLFTSDNNEGWGAVLNEAMSGACAAVSSHCVGSAPMLIQDGENGLIFKSGNVDELYRKTKNILSDHNKKRKIQVSAYKTMAEKWSPEAAANRLMKLIEELMLNGYCDDFADGPCSKAQIIKPNWYR